MTGILAAGFTSYGGAFPVVEATSTFNAGGTTLTATFPSGSTTGDLVIIVLAITAGTSRTFTTPSGWAALRDATGGVNLRRFGIIYRVFAGGEGSSVNISISGSGTPGVAGIAYRISGQSAVPTVPGSGATGNSAAPNPPSHSPAGGLNRYLWLAVEAHEHINPASAAPTNYTPLITSSRSATEDVSVGIAARQLLASSEDPVAFTIPNSSQWFADTIAIPG